MMSVKLLISGKLYIQITVQFHCIMGRIDLNIHDELETKFRDAVYKTMGMKRGNLTTALEEAIMVWLKSKGMETDDKVWPEEEKALEDIKRGKTEMVTQKFDEFLAELKELENEP
ncbi:MAG: hypothetical protein DLM72_00425 [Candidatus Nitrosopolaris wilkensis]|nr:MAG: hypothetical protein DLM72_00425 [Candidatus Nitrosopolaris wilkensis]